MKKLFIILFSCLLSLNALALEYSSVISINVTDKDATSAKQKAWSHANRVALNNVMSKISNNVSLDYLTDDQILNLVKQTEIISEKNSQTSYIGKLKIVFNKEVLDNFLKEKNIQKINISSNKALIIPLYKPSYDTPSLLWEKENLLKEAFSNTPSKGIIKLETIKESLNNYSLANIDNIIKLDQDTLSKLANTNLVEDVFIINAKNYGSQGLSAEVSYYKNGNIKTQTVIIEGETTSPQIFNQAVTTLTSHINQKIKEASLNNKVSENSINAIFNFSNFHQYLWIKNDLKKAPYIKEITPIAMQAGRIEVKIKYSGNYEQLLYTIKTKGLTLRQEMGYYILERI